MSEVAYDGQWEGIKTAKEWIESFGRSDAQFRLRYQQLTTSDDLILVVSGINFSYNDDDEPVGGFVSQVEVFAEDGVRLAVFRDFGLIDASEFYTAFINDSTVSPTGRYQYWVSLLDDNTTATGSSGTDSIEVGAGNDSVAAGAGDDVVFKWKPGALTYDGGSGSDTIVFQAATGVINPPGSTGAIVNLGAGTGSSPFGGAALSFVGVENVIGTDQADALTGSAANNIFGDGLYDTGADVINGLGGNDLVNLAEGAFGDLGGVRANGGPGIDTVAVNLGLYGPTVHRLDLANQASNAGVFFNDVLLNFEVFEEGRAFFAPTGHSFTFVDADDNVGRAVTALGQTNTLVMKGGDDTVRLGYWLPKAKADGGSGKDTLVVAALANGQKNVLDFADQKKNTGTFAGSVFSSFEAVDASKTTVGLTGTSLEFRGGKASETVTGSAFADVIGGGAGNDVIGGGPGNDVLAGGKGKDTFVMGGPLNPQLNLDRITDFKPKDDTIGLDVSVFTVLKPGKLKAKNFVVGKKAKDGNDFVVYDKKTGAAYYDADGKGGDPMVQFALLDKKLGMSHADFMVF